MNLATTLTPANNTEELDDGWTCDGNTLSAAQLLEKIYESGPAMEATMFVPIALYIVVLLLAIDEIIFMFNNVVNIRRTACMLWVIGAFPALCTLAIIGLFMPRSARIIKFSLTFVFAIALKKFFELILLYYGGKAEMEKTLMEQGRISANPFPCCFICCCCRNSRMTMRRIHILQATTYQVIFIYPISYFIQTLLIVEGFLTPLDLGILFLTFECIVATSSLTCMYGYVVLGKASFEPLQQFNIRGKYVCFQLLIAILTLQDVFLDLLGALNVIPCGFPYPNPSRSFALHAHLLVSEIFLVSILVWFMFRRSEKGCVVVASEKAVKMISVSSVTTIIKSDENGIEAATKNGGPERICSNL